MKKIIIFISFISILFISFSIFSRRTITEDNPQSNSQPLKTNSHSTRKQTKIIIFLILIAIGIMIIYLNKKQDKNKNNQKTPPTSKTNFPKTNYHSKISKKHFQKNHLLNKFRNWVCGVIINGNKMQLVLCEQWNAEDFVKQIFDLDVQQKLNIDNEELKKIYNNANLPENKNKIMNFLRIGINLLKNITFSFLEELSKTKPPLLETNSGNFLWKLTSDLYQSQKNQILLTEIDIREDDFFVPMITKNNHQEDFWELFKTAIKSYSVRHLNNESDAIDILFEYSYQFYFLIFKIKEDFEYLLYHSYKIPSNIQEDCEKINNLLGIKKETAKISN